MFYDVHVEQDKSLSVDIYLGGMKLIIGGCDVCFDATKLDKFRRFRLEKRRSK
jgi:hypothetical protein